jgi:hypothetical protein
MKRRRGGTAVPSDAETALADASKDLRFLSETDAPFETFNWGKGGCRLTRATVRKLADAGPKARVKAVAFDDFFGPLTEEHDHTPEEAADVKKYKHLEAVVNDHLSDATVFRVGKITIDVYIVGKTKDGEWVGLKTKAVET